MREPTQEPVRDTTQSKAQNTTQNTTRIAIGVEYDGAKLSGWQQQASPELPTVQGILQTALAQIADEPVRLTVAGRTDAGVHATGQVAHFDCHTERAGNRGNKAWVAGSNSLLPANIRVNWATTVPNQFHARFSAQARRYIYVIQTQDVAPAILSNKVSWSRQHLDAPAMHRAAQHLLGEQDFTSFRAAGCQSNTALRCIQQIAVYARNRFVVIDIQANAFLLHMVRNIAGALMAVGRGEQAPEWIAKLLQARDRTQGEPTASPDGLYLVHVSYPAEYALPNQPVLPPFVGD
ncbi:MAG: tRNA pseudouridine(38-40) synthase TruA [Pseudohongiellaceae bacterium]